MAKKNTAVIFASVTIGATILCLGLHLYQCVSSSNSSTALYQSHTNNTSWTSNQQSYELIQVSPIRDVIKPAAVRHNDAVGDENQPQQPQHLVQENDNSMKKPAKQSQQLQVAPPIPADTTSTVQNNDNDDQQLQLASSNHEENIPSLSALFLARHRSEGFQHQNASFILRVSTIIENNKRFMDAFMPIAERNLKRNSMLAVSSAKSGQMKLMAHNTTSVSLDKKVRHPFASLKNKLFQHTNGKNILLKSKDLASKIAHGLMTVADVGPNNNLMQGVETTMHAGF